MITDHLPVVCLFKRCAFVLWFLNVLEFNPQFKSLREKYNTIADALSRVSEDVKGNQDKYEYSFLVQNVDLDITLVKIEQEKDFEVRRLVGRLLLGDSTNSNYVLLDRLLYL